MNRWVTFLGQWERALNEGKEVIVTGDMNLNHLDWRNDDISTSNQTKKLRPLINELFTQIFPHGVSFSNYFLSFSNLLVSQLL